MSASLWQRVFRGARRLRQRSDWAVFAGLDWPDHIMRVAATDDFHAKQGRSTGRWVIEANGQRLAVYLKRHYRLPWWRGCLAALWPNAGWSPAWQEWRHLQWARQLGLPVPEAVAACEYIGPWGRLQSCLAVEELAGMLPLHQAVPLASTSLDPPRFARWKRTLVAELVCLTRQLHDRHWFHKDLYLCHFYIPEEDTRALPVWKGRVHIIDLHRLAYHPWTKTVWQAKDLAQLLYSSDVSGVSVRDRLRFWRLYLGLSRWTPKAAWLRRHILIKWWSYRRHNAK